MNLPTWDQIAHLAVESSSLLILLRLWWVVGATSNETKHLRADQAETREKVNALRRDVDAIARVVRPA